MNIQIQPNGVLRITAESETEVFALQEWEKKALISQSLYSPIIQSKIYDAQRFLIVKDRGNKL